MLGGRTKVGLAAASKAQTTVSHATPEAETVAADFAMRTIERPSRDLWRAISGKDNQIISHEDNTAMIQVTQTGQNPTMRHLGMTHGVSISRISEIYHQGWNGFVKADTKHMCGDIYTKAFGNREN